jgi:hypothetical protein
MATRDLKSVVYSSDDGRDYATKMDASVFGQETTPGTPDVGGADYDGTPELPPLPRSYKPRYVKVSSATHGKRRVICLDTSSDLWTGTVTTINLPVLGAAAVAFTRYGRTNEYSGIDHDPSQ